MSTNKILIIANKSTLTLILNNANLILAKTKQILKQINIKISTKRRRNFMTIKNNLDIREEIKKAGLRYWQIAEELDIHDSVLSRRLRKELSSQEKEKIRQAINTILQRRTAS